MFNNITFNNDKKVGYHELLDYLNSLLCGTNNIVSQLANTSALLNYFLKDINWVGFYLYDSKCNELLLGPFQGMPACTNIKLGKGVCGTAAELKITMVVSDVSAFSGHIACDANSKSEIVIPLHFKSQLYGVLDIDSPIVDRFDEIDKWGLELVGQLLINQVFCTPLK